MSGGTGVGARRPVAAMHELSEDGCWRLVGAAAVGRVAFTAGQLPKIFPVNHWVDRHTIVFRTAWASSLQLKAGAPVAFEADDTDEMRKIGWSVLVEGRLSAVTDPVEADALTRWTASRGRPGSVTSGCGSSRRRSPAVPSPAATAKPAGHRSLGRSRSWS